MLCEAPLIVNNAFLLLAAPSLSHQPQINSAISTNNKLFEADVIYLAIFERNFSQFLHIKHQNKLYIIIILTFFADRLISGLAVTLVACTKVVACSVL